MAHGGKLSDAGRRNWNNRTWRETGEQVRGAGAELRTQGADSSYLDVDWPSAAAGEITFAPRLGCGTTREEADAYEDCSPSEDQQVRIMAMDTRLWFLPLGRPPAQCDRPNPFGWVPPPEHQSIEASRPARPLFA